MTPNDLTPLPEDGPTEEFVRRAREDVTKFGPLFARFAPTVFAWARLRLLPELRQTLDPEDLVQEVWFRSYERFDTYDAERSGFRGWIFGIANNVLREQLKKLRGRRGSTSNRKTPGSSEINRIADTITSVSRRVARDEALQKLIAEIENLETDEKRLVVLRGLEGLGHAEVAALMAISVDAVEKRWQRVRKKLEATGLPEDFLADS